LRLARAVKNSVPSTSLVGRTILIVEDEPLIALDIATTIQTAGAVTLPARSLSEAMRLVENSELSAAVLDFGLGDGHADPVCSRLNERGIPFILHSGYAHAGDACRGGTVISKPANPKVLIEAIVALFRSPNAESSTAP
jgi:DNA-binding response OmpR family regulator